MAMHLRRLEELALNAWPAEHQQLLDGWLLRSGGGYTKRANSVTPLYDSALAPGAKIVACEQFYARQSLPCTFRLPSFGPPELDGLLERRGYRRLDRTLVLARELDGARPASVESRRETLDRWLEVYSAFQGASPAQRAGHRTILARIAAEPVYLLLHHAGAPVACGLGVFEPGYAGLFDIVVAAERRGQGFGCRTVEALLAWAAERGARQAYLQVVAANLPARRLYASLGFSERYHYWYRQMDPAS
jgi:GNAT superfamily N-acetyltransferase